MLWRLAPLENLQGLLANRRVPPTRPVRKPGQVEEIPADARPFGTFWKLKKMPTLGDHSFCEVFWPATFSMFHLPHPLRNCWVLIDFWAALRKAACLLRVKLEVVLYIGTCLCNQNLQWHDSTPTKYKNSLLKYFQCSVKPQIRD